MRQKLNIGPSQYIYVYVLLSCIEKNQHNLLHAYLYTGIFTQLHRIFYTRSTGILHKLYKDLLKRTKRYHHNNSIAHMVASQNSISLIMDYETSQGTNFSEHIGSNYQGKPSANFLPHSNFSSKHSKKE